MKKMNKHNDVVTLLINLLQSPYAKELCRLQKIDAVKSVQVKRELREDGSRHWKMQLSLENNSFDITIDDNNEEQDETNPHVAPTEEEKA